MSVCQAEAVRKPMECRKGRRDRGITAETVPGDIEERRDPRSDEWCSRRNAAANDAGTSKTQQV